MADFNQINQFGSAKPVRSGEGMGCAECEASLTDALDGTLSAKDRAAFDLHIATCAECSRMLADAQRGAALLEMLKTSRPEPSALLLTRIIEQTSGQIDTGTGLAFAQPLAAGGNAPALFGVVPAGALPDAANIAGSNVLPFPVRAGGTFSLQSFRRTMLQPRLAMTAAMAFFSIALTLNLTGVHVNELKASDLKPSSLKRSFYQADASLVRYYDNLRVVYELESRLRDLQRSNEEENATGAAKPNSKDDGTGKVKPEEQQRKSPKAGSGTSERRNPLQQEFRLAMEHSSRNSNADFSVGILDGEAATFDTYKLKEAHEEGGLV